MREPTDDAGVELDGRIRRFIGRADANELGFDRLALELFAYQFERNDAYRRYCMRLEKSPNRVAHWQDIPAIPAAAFGETRLACFPRERTALTFVSSGTTGAGARRSRHELENSALYDASLLTHLRSCVLPDATSMRLLALVPAFADAPTSSLSYMFSKASEIFGQADDAFYVRDGRLDFEAAAAALAQAKEPLLLAGTAFSFVHFIDRARERGVRFTLPLGSRILETGGFKGKLRAVSRDELYRALSEVFGVPRVLCASEYGMCELGSQWYDANLADYFAGRQPRTSLLIGPHWARTLVVDPIGAQTLPKGESGLLAHYDLSNRGSVLAVLTSDVGRALDGGFELLGRFPGAPPKGCSIAMDSVLAGEHA